MIWSECLAKETLITLLSWSYSAQMTGGLKRGVMCRRGEKEEKVEEEGDELGKEDEGGV